MSLVRLIRISESEHKSVASDSNLYLFGSNTVLHRKSLMVLHIKASLHVNRTVSEQFVKSKKISRAFISMERAQLE